MNWNATLTARLRVMPMKITLLRNKKTIPPANSRVWLAKQTTQVQLAFLVYRRRYVFVRLAMDSFVSLLTLRINPPLSHRITNVILCLFTISLCALPLKSSYYWKQRSLYFMIRSSRRN